MNQWKQGSVKCKWVEVLVPKKQWNDHCSHLGSYTYLGDANGQVRAGCLVRENSLEQEILSDEDFRRIDLHRRASNIQPTPLETQDEKQNRQPQEDLQKKAREMFPKQEEIRLEDIPF
jgi:hypothetical protein